jgi:hypothetical protein
MSNTIAHRPHVHHHVPLLPVLAVIVAIAIAAAVIWAVNQPETVTTTATTSEATYTPTIQPAAVAAPESPVFRHALMRMGIAGGLSPAYKANLHHLVNGRMLDPLSTEPSTGSYAQPDFPRVGQ